MGAGEEPDRWLGTVVGGRYRLERVIGGGGMGAVYEARHVRAGRRVAVKLLHPLLAREQHHVARFMREAQIVSRLEHPHVVTVIDVSGEGDGGPAYCVMELLDGLTLARAVRERGPLDAAEVVRLGRQLLSALHASHSASIVHRDVKPPNVMLVRGYDGLEIVKLVDFGIAHMMETEGYTRLTQTGRIVGTPTYMAPEQALGGDVDARTDVYAAGAVLFLALAGRPAFARADLHELLPRILAGERPRLDALRPDIDPDLVDCIERAMCVDADARFATAADMGAALAGCSRGTRRGPGPTVPLRGMAEPPSHVEETMAATRTGSGGPALAETASRSIPSPGQRVRRRRWTLRALALGAALVVLAPLAACLLLPRMDAQEEARAPVAQPAPVPPVAVPVAPVKVPDAGLKEVGSPDAGTVAATTKGRRPRQPRTRDGESAREQHGSTAPSGPLAVTLDTINALSWSYFNADLRDPIATRIDRTNACLRGIADPPLGGPWRGWMRVTIFSNGETRSVTWGDGTFSEHRGVRQCLADGFRGTWPPNSTGDFHATVEIRLRLARR